MSSMTCPQERTRALRMASEFSQECHARQEQMPVDLWRRLEEILEHFPTTDEVRNFAENGRKMGFGLWCRPEIKDPDEEGWS